MKNYYKIKVGIEEYEIDESDIPRIVEAMKTNEMVKLPFGLFRGQAILAITRDLQREEKERLLAPVPKTQEQIDKEKISKQMESCTKCTECKGWNFIVKDGQRFVKPCSCTMIK